jgi:hypothetical protein
MVVQVLYERLLILPTKQYDRESSYSEYKRPRLLYLIFFVLQVTGGNKGIGYAIIDKLCSAFDGIIYLTGK